MRKRNWYEFTTKSEDHKNILCYILDKYNIRYDLSYSIEVKDWLFTILFNKNEKELLDKYIDLCLNDNVQVRGGIFDLG
jgi:hypothetical protein